MRPAARFSDASADGRIVEGSPDTLINYLPAARLGDVVKCPHATIPILTGSGNVFINSRFAARLYDVVACPMVPGTIMAGSPTVFIGG